MVKSIFVYSCVNEILDDGEMREYFLIFFITLL